MTGLECLKEELQRRGCTKAQCESKVIAIVLDILTNAENNHEEEYQKKADIEALESDRQSILRFIDTERKAWEEDCKRYKQQILDMDSYIQNLFSAIERCETAEGRDTLKLAQMFVNSVNIRTAYDNTAFIIGLSAILSHGDVAPLEELKKINTRIPGLNHDYHDGNFYTRV